MDEIIKSISGILENNLEAEMVAITFAVIGWLLRYCYVQLKFVLNDRLPARRLLGFDFDKKITFIVPTIKNMILEKSEYTVSTTTLEPLYLFKNTNKIFSKARSRQHLVMDFKFSADCSFDSLKNTNVFLVGGPVNNLLTKDLYKKINLGFYFEGHDLKVAGKVYRAVIDENDCITKDYAVLARIKNPYCESGSGLFHLAGCRVYGSVGASKYLATMMEIGSNKELKGYNVDLKKDLIAVYEMDVEHSNLNDSINTEIKSVSMIYVENIKE